MLLALNSVVSRLLQIIPGFSGLKERAFWKHYGKTRKCSTIIFSPPLHVVLHFIEKSSYIIAVKFNPFPNDTISDSSKLKQFADDNFKFDENDRKLSRRVEHTVWKGEIACYEQFLLFPHCFLKTCTADT